MARLNQKLIITVFSALAVIYLLLAIVGGICGYSPVPYWDMWDGYINFFIKASSGDLSAWYAQHNEHRIVLARALFWLDLTLFKGAGLFLISVNYLLAGLSWLVLSTALKESLHQKTQPVTQRVLQLGLLCLLFSWIQKENFTWAFQSQFFLAQLLPLVSFYLMHRAYITKGYPHLLFSLACLTGIAALGTMANGVLTLPLMTVLALLLRLSWQRVLLLLTLSVLSLYIYFQDYTACAHHGSLKEAVLHHPIELLQYVLIYLGGPFYYIGGSKLITQLAGVVLIVCSLKMAYKSLKQITPASLPLALLTFILYIALTAVGTAGGRLILGMEGATSSRYVTPSLMAWSALLILYAPALASRLIVYPKRCFISLLLVPILLLPQQITVCHPNTNEYFEKQIAGLALALNIKDQPQIKIIYPNVNHVLSVAKIAVEKNISIFGEHPFKKVHQLIGQTELTELSAECRGHLDNYVDIENEPGYIKVSGWLFEPNSKTAPQAIAILNAQNVIVGYALSGQLRPDVAHHLGRKAKRSGFKGYLRADSLDQPLRLYGKQPACQLSVPPLPKHTSKVTQ